MKRWKVWASIIALFVSGLLVGSAGTALYIKHALEKIVAGGPPEVRRVIARRIARELRLTAEQRPQMEEVLRATQEKILQIRLKNEPLVEQIVREGAGEMKPFLNQQQQARLDALLEETLSRFMLYKKQPK